MCAAKAAELEEFQPRFEAAEIGALARGQERIRHFLAGLAAEPPQVLLLEGGSSREREALALWFAAACNCTSQDRPCLACASCLRIVSGASRDLFFFDGSQGSIKIGENADDEGTIRWLRPVLGEPPREGPHRAVILNEAQSLTLEAANALLKSLEEPRPGTTFLLLAPQRERLLPTLVSRGFALTLGWPDSQTPAACGDWMDTLMEFLRTGRGWVTRTSGKKAVDKPTAVQLVLACQKALALALMGMAQDGLARLFAGSYDTAALRRADILLGDCIQALDQGVNPALVLDRMAVRLFTWRRK